VNLLTLREVAQRLSVSLPTVRRLIATGDLRAVLERGCLRVREADLRAHVSRLPVWTPAWRPRRKANGSMRTESAPGILVEQMPVRR